MSTARFRALALALPEAEEGSHFGKVDFRVRKKIFAGFSANGRAYVKLGPEQQDMLTAAAPTLITVQPGGWGRQGWTLIDQDRAQEDLLGRVLAMAWATVAPRSLVKREAQRVGTGFSPR
jgi:hypothetical protein